MSPQDEVPRLRSARLRHWFVLLWWLCYHPQRIKAHDEQFNPQARYPVGNHLVNLLAWLPMLIAALALMTRPALAQTWNRLWELTPPPYTYPFLVLLPAALIPPLLTRVEVLDRNWAGTFAGMLAFAVVFNVVGGIMAGVKLTIVGGIAFVVAAAIAGAVAMVTCRGVVFGVMFGTAFAIISLVGFRAGEAGIMVFFGAVAAAICGGGCIASVLANGIEDSIRRGELTRLNTAIIPLMLTVYGAIVWVCFTAPPIHP
ncbi:MAG: hypothetical protein AAFU54_25200 [Chloroflexota bacterium]